VSHSVAVSSLGRCKVCPLPLEQRPVIITRSPATLASDEEHVDQQGEFEWSRAFQGHVLSSYFYGYLSTMFLGGWLGGRYGGKHVVGVGLLVSSLATMLIPVAVRFNDYLIIVLRVFIGMSTVYNFIFIVCINNITLYIFILFIAYVLCRMSICIYVFMS